MKLREKLTAPVKRARDRVRNWSGWQKLGQSKAVRGVGQAVALCRANPFPARLVLMLLYRLALDVLYLTMISPVHAYAGFTTDLARVPYLCTWVTLLVFAPFVTQLNGQESPSDLLVTFLNYFYFIPLTSYCGCRGMNLQFFAIALAYWALLLLWQFRLPFLHAKQMHLSHIRPVMVGLTVVSCLFILFISGRYTGFRFTLDVTNVYGIRAEAAGYAIPRIFSYALSMMGIVMSVLLLYWLQRKRWLVAAGLVVVYLFLFSIAAQKILFFFLFLLLASSFLFRPWMVKWMPGLLTLAVGAAALEKMAVGSDYVMDFFFRRMMYLPVKLSEQYLTFFQKNPINLFRDGIMSKFSFSSLYSTTIPRVIGEFRNHPTENANNGLIGDLAANLPVLLGLLLMPLILVVCFRVLDLLAHGKPPKIVAPFCLYFATSFIDSSWSTVLLSHGFLLACLLLYFFPDKEGPVS